MLGQGHCLYLQSFGTSRNAVFSVMTWVFNNRHS